MKKCELCDARAKTYCESDQASLCWSCDANVHAANFIVAKHSRTLLCHLCQAPTLWNASGRNLGPTVSVCHVCIHSQNVTPPENDGRDVREDDDQDTTDDGFDEDDVDGNEDDGDGGGGREDDNQSSGGDGGDEDNQVVPLSPPPVSSSSNSEESWGEAACIGKESLSRPSVGFSRNKRMGRGEKQPQILSSLF